MVITYNMLEINVADGAWVLVQLIFLTNHMLQMEKGIKKTKGITRKIFLPGNIPSPSGPARPRIKFSQFNGTSLSKKVGDK